MRWDPEQYTRYADERGRPFTDLLARVTAPAPRRVVDLGCGPGNLTARLAQRWPGAAVEGVDSSPEMIARASAAGYDRVRFRVGDVCEWAVPADCDVLVANAVLQWVPTHRELLREWAGRLPAGGWLAFQVPGNFDSPSHTLLRELASSARWAALIGPGVLRHHDAVAEPAQYAALLLAAGLRVDVWETTYLHVLPGPDPVLEWMRGTGLRPVLAALPDPQDAARFEAEYAAALREGYPRTEHGTVLSYRRIFAVGHKPGDAT
jgi:trans-aconitate 2-methyltransferase